MPRLRSALLFTLCTSAAAVWANPLKTPACQQAVAQLEHHEAAWAALPASAAKGDAQVRAVSKGLEQARAQVAKVCLRATADAPPPAGRLAQPPVNVSPVNPGTAARPRIAAMLPPVATPKPAPTITTCDAAGCWASDGSRLQRVGPQLLGPKGFCSTSGAVLNCP